MKFRYIRIPFRANDGIKITSILRPLIRIGLKTEKSESIDTLALIDSGADFCLSPADFGEQIGMLIENDDWLDIVGIESKPIRFFFHNITLIIGGWEKNCKMGFSRDAKFEHVILGQKGFFDLYKVSFDFRKEEIELKEYSVN